MGMVIGLTGGIGSGKSLVAGLLAERGAALIDADTAAHEVYRPGSDGWRAVVAAFGDGIVDEAGAISRPRLGRIVFSDADARGKLNAIVHPRVRRLLADRIAQARRGGARVVVVEVPLLVEAIRAGGGWTRTYDEVWVVTAPERQVIDRLLARGMTEARIRAVMAAQASTEERLRYADVAIDNSAGIDRLRERVAALWDERLEARAT
ncbi:MAG: dephospho-CoA kinase [Spirochaetaceae bacterium]|nr:dephospho-CoA kinase [Spirochaetaceae bacterium]